MENDDAPALSAEDVGMALATLATAFFGALERQGIDGKDLHRDVAIEIEQLMPPLKGTPVEHTMRVLLSALVWSHPEGPMAERQ